MYLRALMVATLCGLTFGAPACAETIEEVWRGPFGVPRSLSVNPTDSSVWAATGSTIMHIAADGTVLNNLVGFANPNCVSVNSADGSCWVADRHNRQVVHLSAEGTELWRGDFGYVVSVSVNPSDGSCWVGDSSNEVVIHLSADGQEVWRSGRVRGANSLSVNPNDGSCWVLDMSEVVHFSAEGVELWRGAGFFGPQSVSVNPTDGSCWVADRFNDRVVRLSAEGEQLVSKGGFSEPMCVSVNAADGSCWVADWDNMDIVHLSAEGVQLWRGAMPYLTWSVAVNPTDGSCWIGDYTVAHLSADGTQLWRGGGLSNTYAISVNSADGSCWVADYYHSGVVHLSEEGVELWRGEAFDRPMGVSVNPSDGSCWVADYGNSQLVHLSSEHEELWRGDGFAGPEDVSVNPTDGSCWVADRYNGQVVHLSSEGVELWRGGGGGGPQSVSVNPIDGSCWVAAASGQVAHLSEAGAVLCQKSGYVDPGCVSVNPTDGSCWATDFDVIHFSEEGQVLWSDDTFSAEAVSVDPNDGSVWVADTFNHEVAHLAADGTELSRKGGFWYPWGISVNPADGSCWVADTKNHQAVHLVLVPAVTPTTAFSATPTSGTAPLTVDFTDLSANLPSSWSWEFGDGESSADEHPTHTYSAAGIYTVSLTAGNEAGADTETKPDYITAFFPDVDPDHWACEETLACVGAGIVSGYEDGLYHPDWAVDRAQMAVYIARALVAPSGEAALTDYLPADPRNFPDAPPTGYGDDGTEPYWAYTHIEYCVENGIVEGYGDGLYHPDEEVTRAQMAVYVARSLVAPTGDAALADYVPANPRDFPDASPTGYGDDGTEPYWAYTHIEYCVENGVVQGYQDGLYHPDEVVTRAQMAVYVARAFGLGA